MPRNVVMNFRRAFHLESIPDAAHLHISADCRYILYCNSGRIGYGPARAYQFNYGYDTYDVYPYLTEGDNVIAVSVLHWGEGTFQHLVGRGGLLVQLDAGEVIVSDASWRVKRATAHRQDTLRISPQLAWEEQYDARFDDAGWTLAGYDDSSWETAVEVGPVGTKPWTQLSPRTIPFLSDELISPVRAKAIGKVRRPDVIAAIHMTPYVAPGDVSSNQQKVDALIATVLHVPQEGEVTVKKCSTYRAGPRVFLDSEELEWQRDTSDFSANRFLEAGVHILLLDWQAKTNDLDFSMTASGAPGLAVSSPLSKHDGTWAIALLPGDVRAEARRAKDVSALLNSGAPWQTVATIDSPGVDVYMDISASTIVEPNERTVSFPITVAPTEPQHAQHFVIDFGREIIGWIELEVEAHAGTVVDCLGFEGIQNGERKLTQLMNNTMRYTCRDGRQAYTSIIRRGFRYLLLAVHNNDSDVTIHRVITHMSTYPGVPRGAFRCSDPRLNQVWDMSAYTLRLCSEDTFTDCPAYEQTMWVGDAFTDVLIHHVVHGDAEFVERNLRLAGDSLQRMPIANSQVPSAWEDSPIPNWSWMWVLACRAHYEFSGHTEFVREIYSALAKQARFIDESREAQGLFAMPGAWHFLDWTALDAAPDFVMAHENCLAIVALRATAELAEVIGEIQDAARWRVLADGLRDAVDRVFWSGHAQAYVDSVHEDGILSQVVSQPTNISALYAGIATGGRADAIAPNVVTHPTHWVGTGSPFMLYFNCEVLTRQGRYQEMQQLIRERWGDMLDRGATTTWETFRGFGKGQEEGAWTRSWCHAWSATPAYFLSAYVLGIRPLTPGFKQAVIAPRLGDLTWIKGRVPTPQGTIEVDAERTARGLVLRVQLPAEVSAEVHLPRFGDAVPKISGATADVCYSNGILLMKLPAGALSDIELG